MTNKMPTHHEVDCTTGEVTVRDFTQEEYDAWVAQSAAYEAQLVKDQAAAQALEALKASAKAKLIAGQPLTEEEAATIVL
jgi:hypothetical protein